MDPAPWLDEAEQRAWRELAAVFLRLPGALETQLQRDAGLSHFEYWVMALLSEADGRARRLRALADQANCSLSRLSHVVTRLEGRGWIVRKPNPDDARSTLAALTDAGYGKVVEAAPGHARAVRSLVFADLDDDDVAALERVCGAIATRIDRAADAEL